MKNKQQKKLKKHKIGFYQITPLPSKLSLEKYYRDRYYQAPTVSTYSKRYSQDEHRYRKIACEVVDYIAKKIRNGRPKTVLDVGCGEGFFLEELKSLKWKITGTDFSCAGIKRHNPQIAANIFFGPFEKVLPKLKSQNKKFFLINLGNILEHVLNPMLLLKLVSPLLIKNGIVRLVVPNDTSGFQKLLEKEKRSRCSWITPPDHLSYFNFESLEAVLSYCGYVSFYKLGDFPIELYLLNKHSNYENHKEYGTEAHLARVKTSLYVRSKGIKNYIRWASGLAAGGTTRSCIVFAKKIQNKK